MFRFDAENGPVDLKCSRGTIEAVNFRIASAPPKATATQPWRRKTTSIRQTHHINKMTNDKWNRFRWETGSNSNILALTYSIMISPFWSVDIHQKHTHKIISVSNARCATFVLIVSFFYKLRQLLFLHSHRLLFLPHSLWLHKSKCTIFILLIFFLLTNCDAFLHDHFHFFNWTEWNCQFQWILQCLLHWANNSHRKYLINSAIILTKFVCFFLNFQENFIIWCNIHCNLHWCICSKRIRRKKKQV